jgi:hypothetical protein
VEEFLAFLCKACFASFYFAHRIVWFLKALMNPENIYNEKIKNILHIIQTIFKSERSKEILERLHIAGCKNFIEYLNKNNFLPIYLFTNLESQENISTEQLQFLNHHDELRETLNKLIDIHYNNFINNNTEIDIETDVLKLKHEDIYINIFKRYESITNDEDNITTQYIKQIDTEDINLSSFLSNINFIDHLCNICEIIRSTNLTDQNKTLINEMMKVNKFLPANIYVPFHRESIRYYIIANIPISEIKIFKTKNRAPYMVTVEAFRVEEVTRKLNKEGQLIDDDLLVKKRGHSKTVRDTMNNSSEDINNKNRSMSFESKLIAKQEGDVMRIPQSRAAMNKTFIEKGNNNKNKSKSKLKEKQSKTNYLQVADIDLSKPILIKNIYALDNNKRKSKELMNYEEVDVDTTYDPKKIHEVVHRASICEKSDHSINYTGNNIENEKRSSTENNPLDEFNKDELLSSLNKRQGKFRNSEDIFSQKRGLVIPEEEKDGESHENEDNIIKQDEDVVDTEGDGKGKDPVFGEKIEEQTERLRKLSPYGNLSTYTLFKFIVKSGEDLRQEQFATQLINEFNQIFKLEKVECWVNTYEILATGNNCGIIEVVPNAISLDQLIRKFKNYSGLNNFYQTYFGPTNSDKYKRALDNFISSVAGYSLVCYFLQIKDRHNGNIMIDDKGHIIHIDFGFMLSNAPGKGIQFEKAPFKLTKEFVDVMGGVNSKYFNKFRKLLWK